MNNLDLDKLIPGSIDAVIRVRRDQGSLRVLSDIEIAALPGINVTRQMSLKGTIEGWYIIRLDMVTVNQNKTFMIGRRNGAPDKVFNTSTIAGIDIADGLVVTKNSIYRIGEQGQGEPDSDLILYVCNVLHRMGVGEIFGVLDIFY